MASEKATAKAIYVFETALVEGGSIREQNQQRLLAALDAAAAVDGDAQWNAAIEAAAKIAKESSFPFPIEVWLNSTKKEMTALVGNAIAVAIRSLKRG